MTREPDKSLVPENAETTMVDLAERLGVSVSTVSRALSGSPGIGEKTRKRVIDAARAANYSVNPTARNLRQRTSRTIEVIFPLAASGSQQIADPFYLDMLAVVAEALGERDYDLLLAQHEPWKIEASKRNNRTDGMILIGQGQDQKQLRAFAQTYRNLVVWGARTPEDRHVTVGTDNVQGGKLATEHLISIGARKIAFVGDAVEPEIAQRREGFLRAMREAGYAINESLMFRAPFDAHRARLATQAAVACGRDFDAVFCASDVIALNMIDALRASGRRVPEDVAVIGYDNISLAFSYGQSLTTVSQEIPIGGRLLVDILFSLINGEEVGPATIPARLMVRNSTSPQR